MNLLNFDYIINTKRWRLNDNLLMIGIFLFAFILRILFITGIPKGLIVDEVDKGYNAYSLLKTGKSYRGLHWPTYFTSFSKTQPSSVILYQYIVVISVALFGLNTFAIRLPAVLLGSFAVPILFLLAKELFQSKQTAFLAALFLAISPWHIFLSRNGLEPISYHAFYFATICFLIKFVTNESPRPYERDVFFFSPSEKRGASIPNLTPGVLLQQNKQTNGARYLYTSIILGAITLYTYQSAIFSIPVLFLVVISYYWKHFLQHIKLLMIASVFGIIILTPLLYTILSNKFLFGHFIHETYQNIELTTRVFYFLQNIPKQLIAMFLFCAPCLVIFFGIGVWYLLIETKKNITNWFIPRLLLILMVSTVVPAAACKLNGSIDIYKSSPVIGFAELFAAVGLTILYKKNKIFFYISLLLILVTNIFYVYIINSLFIKALHTSSILQPDIESIVENSNKYVDTYDHIIITTPFNQPFIYFLFYNKYPPDKFLTQDIIRYPRDKDQTIFYEEVYNFDKYIFTNRSTGPAKDIPGKNLYLINKDDFNEDKFNLIEDLGCYVTRCYLFCESKEDMFNYGT